jgi:hypothetical protein
MPQPVTMQLRKVSGCSKGECPAVFMSDQGTVVFQGEVVTSAEGLRLSPGEQAVELPLDVVRNAIPELIGGQ